MNKYASQKRINTPFFITETLILQWQQELLSFYGYFFDSGSIVHAVYFCLGGLYQIDKETFFPFINPNGDLVNNISTMKREMLFEALTLLKTGYMPPKGKDTKVYADFVRNKLTPL